MAPVTRGAKRLNEAGKKSAESPVALGPDTITSSDPRAATARARKRSGTSGVLDPEGGESTETYSHERLVKLRASFDKLNRMQVIRAFQLVNKKEPFLCLFTATPKHQDVELDLEKLRPSTKLDLEEFVVRVTRKRTPK